jgi:pSer/pThr/pTyr-binding forkhead associated (FHA) protein
MPRCSNCGKLNREGSLFCQDCGHRLEAVKPAAAAAAPAAIASTVAASSSPVAAGGATCGSCGTANPAGMSFCKMCGSPLVGKPAEATPTPVAASPSGGASASPAGKVTCRSCGKSTPGGFSFCQHCGQRLQPAAAAPAPAAMGVAATVAHSGPLPTPPAGVPRAVVTAPAPVAAVSAPRPSVVNDDALAQTVAPSMSQQMAAEVAAHVRAVSGQRPVGNSNGARPRLDTMPDSPTMGRLVTLRRDGSDGDVIDLVGPAFDIGRLEGQLRFADDPYLAPRHARFQLSGGRLVVQPLDTVNGVYVRVRGAVELQAGDQFLVGKEVLRFEPLAPEERDPPSLVEHGVRLFGSAPREAWGRVRQITVAGTTRDVWHLVRPEMVLGREEGDVTFPDDEFMSRRHVALKRAGARARLEDLGSSNGTFVRIRNERVLEAGDVVRMGDQLMRFEP